jgi:hypothetical protein
VFEVGRHVLIQKTGQERVEVVYGVTSLTGRVPIFPVNTCNEKGIRAGGPTELTTEPESPMMLQRR